MSAGPYGDLATGVCDLDKPTGYSFGDVEFYKLVLENSGFSDITVCADYEMGKEPERTDQSLTFEARRA